MKKLSQLALAFAFLAPLTGCPGDDSGSDTDNTNNTEGATDTPATDGETDTPGETDDPPATDGEDDTSTGGGPSGGFCIHQCEGDGDCTIEGMDVGLTCQDGFCAGEPVEGCTSDDECIAQLSGWEFGPPCTAGGGECEAAMQVCLDVGGEGHCVSAPSEFFMCETAMLDEIETTDIDGNMVTVCGNAGAACGDDGFCFSPCQSDDDCASEAFPVCNTDTGSCECGEDAHCATLGNEGTSVCNGGVCGCGEDQNCVDGGQGDVCNDGFCGCSGDMACADVENTFDGGMISCVEV